MADVSAAREAAPAVDEREPSLLAIRGLHVTYPQREQTIHAVNGVSLDIRSGTSWGIVGETGCGKSSLIRAVAGLLPQPGRISSGQVLLRGRDLAALNAGQLRRVRAREIGFMPQNAFAALHPVLSVARQFRDVIKVGVPGVSRAEGQERATALLGRVGIEDPDRVLRSYAHQLSGGMAQRVVLAMTMIREPEVIMADEPTTGLDLRILRQIMDILAETRRERATTTVLVTHDLGVVAQYCEHVVVMYAGQVIEVGPVERVMARPVHPYTRALIGAVPRRGRPLTAIAGAVPYLTAAPIGCSFYERCPRRDDPRCQTERPPLRAVAPDHRVASFYAGDEAASS